MTASITDIWSRRELLWILIGRNLKIRYKQSVLGFFWSLLGPLLMILIYAVFASILKFNTGRPYYLPFLVIGIVVWQFLAMCLGDSLHAIVGNTNLIKKTSFPRIILPLAMVLANLINFLLSCTVLLIYLVVIGIPFEHVWLLPFIILMQSALCLGMGLTLATANVFFRDTEHLLGVGILAWFFLSPIFYPVTMQLEKFARFPPWARFIPFLNPMTGIVWLYRRVLMSSTLEDVRGVPPEWLAVSMLVTCLILLIGLCSFRRFDPRFGDEL